MSVPTVRLADVTTKIGSGVTPRGGSAVYKSAGRPFIRSQNVGWGELRLDDMAFIDEATHSAFPATEIRAGDVLLNITGASIGRSAVATPTLEGGNVNQHVCEIRLKQGRMDPLFVNAYLLSQSGQGQIEMFQAGGNRQGLNFQQVGSIQVPDLPIEQQRAIGSASQDADDLYSALERLIAKKQAIKQGMMQQLLTGRTRLPGFTEEWGKSTVGDEFDVQLGKRLDAAVNRGALKTCINNRGVRWGRILLNEAVEAPLTDVDIQTLKLLPGDVLVCEGGEIGRSAVWRGELPEAFFLNTLHRLRSRSGFNPYLLAALFEHWGDTGQLFAVVGKGTLAHLTKEKLVRVPVPVPGREEQERIANVLKDVNDELEALRSRLIKARDIKTGMMQQLLTGRTRLPVESES